MTREMEFRGRTCPIVAISLREMQLHLAERDGY